MGARTRTNRREKTKLYLYLHSRNDGGLFLAYFLSIWRSKLRIRRHLIRSLSLPFSLAIFIFDPSYDCNGLFISDEAYRVRRRNRSVSSNPNWQLMPRLKANYLLMQISDGHNLAIKLIESMSGHVSSELALSEANSDLAHKCLSSRNPEAPGYHFLS